MIGAGRNEHCSTCETTGDGGARRAVCNGNSSDPVVVITGRATKLLRTPAASEPQRRRL